MKECFICKTLKPISEFYKHKETKDGYLNKCKLCTKAGVRLNRRKNKEYYALYDKKRGKRQSYDYTKEYRNNNPNKTIAHRKVAYALRIGKLFKLPCEICGDFRVEAHHEDYKNPLDVIWLCSSHHKWIHG